MSVFVILCPVLREFSTWTYFIKTVHIFSNTLKGHEISKVIFLETPLPKKQTKVFVRISALAFKMGQNKKIIMLISEKLLFNIIKCLNLFDLTHFRG